MPTQPPPVNVSVGPNGELIITSPDTEAIDLFEEMVQGFVPQRRDFKVFYLKHASAFNVVLNLEEYFEIDKKKDNNNRRPYYYFGYDDFGSSSNKNDTAPPLQTARAQVYLGHRHKFHPGARRRSESNQSH